jgi:hypothetical protein
MCDMYSDNDDLDSDNQNHKEMSLSEVYLRETDFERLYDNLNVSYKFPICDIKLNEENNELFDVTSFFLMKRHPLYVSESFYFLRYDYTFDPVRLGRKNVFLLRYPIIMQGFTIE